MAEAVSLNIKLERVRIARVSLATPFKGRPGADGKVQDPKYHLDAIVEMNDPQLDAFKQLMRAAIVAKFADQADVVQQWIVANNKLCLHRGDIDRAGKPEYAGKLYISANNVDQPTIVVQEGNILIANRGTAEILSPTHPKYPYAGCFADVHLNLFAYSHPTGGKGVSAQLNGVRFVDHGEKLRSSSVSALSEFGLKPTAADDAPPPAAGTGGAGLI